MTRPDPPSARSGRPRRFVRPALGLLLILTTLWFVAAYFLFYNPSVQQPERADAVVVLGGASAERLPEGKRLVEEGYAPLLVLSSTGLPGNSDADQLCGLPAPSRICFSPEPLTTRGEARSVARLAQDYGWEKVLVVTSRYHAVRSLTNLQQCSDAAFLMVPTAPDLGPVEWFFRFVEESVGLAAAQLRPACASPI
ncbi:uncharacterized SAM-binding protein YcdF (DUF218 family) [Arthrobacter sp. CAN_A6]|uniref:YdcF family protein n=1 Tax=Arthrobacter sp. CAN_A6 TaxID=2787721 RepID=UPI001A1B707A